MSSELAQHLQCGNCQTVWWGGPTEIECPICASKNIGLSRYGEEIQRLVDVGYSREEATRAVVEGVTQKHKPKRFDPPKYTDPDTGKEMFDSDWDHERQKDVGYHPELHGLGPTELLEGLEHIKTDREEAQGDVVNAETLQREVKVETTGGGSSGRKREPKKPKPTSMVDRVRFDEVSRSKDSDLSQEEKDRCNAEAQMERSRLALEKKSRGRPLREGAHEPAALVSGRIDPTKRDNIKKATGRKVVAFAEGAFDVYQLAQKPGVSAEEVAESLRSLGIEKPKAKVSVANSKFLKQPLDFPHAS